MAADQLNSKRHSLFSTRVSKFRLKSVVHTQIHRRRRWHHHHQGDLRPPINHLVTQLMISRYNLGTRNCDEIIGPKPIGCRTPGYD
ncbi:hypothetical protein M408DRAFT_227708 [Serendipita vermifera MAFF 305830]|uniref:Uncharacterized protein n=1 Tax=Serendipita vermifera MAFF 305830 TaxID=933852 RepID=A0A0C3B008_SERVB|nr:hypothetical protein M408DRAFT_227708 [Serendipita vermifera MAFF 305830]